jgi:DhnA family fructose-bisphosphate aldolase class Ia
MQQVVSEVAPALGAAGFRKRRNTFNRAAETGMMHVVSFQR